jgi:HEAT repeat protein
MNLCQLALVISLAIPSADEPTKSLPADLAADEQTLKAANVNVTPSGLVDFFHKRVPSTENDAAVAPLIKQLSDKDADMQKKAEGQLIALGPAALKPLQVVANNIQDLGAADRAKACMKQIEGPNGAAVVRMAVRLLAAHKPEGAAAALIDYFPFADDESVTRELEQALPQVAMPNGKFEAALLRALEDESAPRRAAAAAALCQAGGISAHEKVRPLLKDTKPTVRFQVALALANAYDADAVPVLIDALSELQPAQQKQAEDWLSELGGEWSLKAPQGADATSRKLRRELWLTWWKNIDGKQLTEEFKSRTLSDEDYTKAQDLIKKLDDNAADVREKASKDLVALGPKVVPLLHRASQHSEGRIPAAAVKCAELIEKGAPNPLPQAAPRLLAMRRPAGTLETFLTYLPFVESETASVELTDLIVAVGIRDGKPDPVLVKALEDKLAVRRGVAAHALCRANGRDHLPAVRKLLQDPDLEVRLRTAQAMVSIGERDAVPVMIALLNDLPLSQAFEVDEYLSRLAGDKRPEVPSLAADAAARAKCRDAWAAWWNDKGETVDLVKVEATPRFLGLTLIVDNIGRVGEVDLAGKVRWKIEGLQGPLDAQVLPGQRVLVAEQNIHRVSERDLTGKILWEKNQKDGIINPFVCQRLRDGNTFIACRNSIVEFDRAGKQVYSIPRQTEYLMAATKFRDGTIGYINNQGRYVRMNTAGKEIKAFNVPNAQFGVNYVEILPNDHILMFAHQLNKLVEYSPDGKTVWEASVQTLGMPCRLPNGHTLSPNLNTNRVTELDRSGKVVSELKDFGLRPYRVSRR